MASYTDLLPQLTANLGQTFKTFDPFSDGVGNTISDFYAARPDLFQGVDFNAQRQIGYSDNAENPQAYNYMDFGGANDLLRNYEVQRRGEAGMEDGRRDVVVDKRTGQIVYAGANPYSYDPAATTLKDAATFAALVAGGYGLAGLAGGAAAGAGAAAAGGEAAAGLSGLDAAMLDMGAGLSGGAGGSVVGGGAAAGGSMLGGALPELAMPAGNALGGGIGGAATGSTGGMFGGSMGGMLGTALDFAKANPKLVGGLLGGLLGGTGGSSGGSGYSYKGPMPTITRGNWQPSATPQLRQAAPQAVTMPTHGNQYSGLLRYLGGG